MTTLRATIKNAAQSVRTFLTKSVSKSSSPKEGTATPGHHARKRKPVFGLFKEKQVATHPVIHAVGILGIVDNLNTLNAGWMVSDFAAWIFLISLMQGYHPDRSSWLSIRPVSHLFPSSSVIFGDAGCDRLVLPLPRLDSGVNPNITADNFSWHCMCSLKRIAKNVKHGEKLVILLVGYGLCRHSDGEDPTFHFQLAQHPNETTGEASISKIMLEDALKKCRGEIVIICNSCNSDLLASDRWTLLCSAGPMEAAESLSQSYSSPNHGCLASNSLLVTLATAMPATEYLPRTPKATYASVSAELRRHIYAPTQYAFPPQTDTVGTRTLLLVLKSYHVQDVAMQVLARELGWRDASCKVEIFLPQKIANWDFYEVIKSGIRIDELLWHLKATHFPWLWPKLDHNSAWWLWSQWNAAERPSISRHQWDELVKKVGFMTKSEAIC
ncbi:hypothetical protein GALMADRAFT_224624 [Galerina marginata CBS 339.88]|uniref:Uncharacterized protein n=1 Tax=Galerina marginata (strain CBS 339.88) TaxID=685588 RepID=A0A067T7A9_GALM3|nr:hypothetical protein GALMADRAFT_224624 [Galerina marginata CBS 339.88]